MTKMKFCMSTALALTLSLTLGSTVFADFHVPCHV